MASDKPEFDGFLALIDAKIAALQQFRESYLALLSVGGLGQTGSLDLSLLGGSSSAPAPFGPLPAGASATPPESGGRVELPTGVFRNKGLADAIRMYLSIAKRKQTNKEIANALREGGLATTAPESFDNTLSATLYRLKNAGELLKFKDGWDLAESYPASFRQRLEDSKESTPKRKKKKAKNKKAAAATPKEPKAGKPAEKPADKPGHQEPILKAV